VLDSFRRIAQNKLRAENRRRRQAKQTTARHEDNKREESETHDVQDDLSIARIDHSMPIDARFVRQMSPANVIECKQDVLLKMTESLRTSLVEISVNCVVLLITV